MTWLGLTRREWQRRPLRTGVTVAGVTIAIAALFSLLSFERGYRDGVRRELERLQRDEREMERQRELLQYQVDEITAATLRPGELEDLERERKLLVNAERLGELCVAVYSALAGDETSEASGALDLLASAQRSLGDLLRLDDTLREQLGELEQALYLAQDQQTAVRRQLAAVKAGDNLFALDR